MAVSKLQDGSINFWDTPNAINDANTIKETLEKYCGFPTSNIFTLFKEKASKNEILRLIEEVCKKTKKDDRLLIFFAGHGNSTKIKGTEEGYIIPFDAVGKKGKPEWKSVIGFNDLTTTVAKNTNANQILFLIDCCFSGIACKLQGLDDTVRSSPDDMSQSATTRKSIEIYTASSANEKIADKGLSIQNSIFTYQIVEFIKNAKANEYPEGFISARVMSTRVTVKVTAESFAIGKRQEPQFIRQLKDELGEFVVRQFTHKEIEESKDEPEIEFSEIDNLIAEANLYDILQDKDKMLGILKRSIDNHGDKILSLSKISSLIYQDLGRDEYISFQLCELKEKKKLSDEKIREILTNIVTHIIAIGVKERHILTLIPMNRPRNKNNGVK